MNPFYSQPVSWRWYAAALLFLFGFTALLSGVSLSERPSVLEASWLTKAYYTLGLFVVGGLDVGTPEGGALWARGMLWVSYFGAPLLTASAVLEAVFQVLKPARWQLRNLRDHIIIFGSGPMTLVYLRLLEMSGARHRVVVVDADFDPVREQELNSKPGVRTLVGNLTHDYLLRLLRLKRARRVVLLGDNDFQSYEAASRILAIAPQLEGRVIMRIHNLRFMRSLAETRLASRCEIFNSYNLAAQGFVRDQLRDHFVRTASKDTVVIAGLGRFGQSVLEELQETAADQIKEVVVVDVDADRRVLVVAEQERLSQGFSSHVFQGDIGHPEVWRRVTQAVDLTADEPTVILGTGRDEENLRTALWVKKGFPNAQVYARTTDISQFAISLGEERDVRTLSITLLVAENMPERWLN